MSAILSFFGGTAFRLIFGELVAYFTRKEEARIEAERLRLEGELDAAAHARTLEALRLQSDLGVKAVAVQRDADVARIDAGAWADAVSAVGRSTGIRWVDAWNGCIRPGLATLATVALGAELIATAWVLTEFHREIIGGILGIYIADRSLAKRGR